MIRTAATEKNRQKWLGNANTGLEATDPELAAIGDGLLFGQILEKGTLTDVQKSLLILVTLTAIQTPGPILEMTDAALRVGASPEQIKEALYQCAPYIGISRVEAALKIVNSVFKLHNIDLPLPKGGTVNEESRLKSGLAIQHQIFGAEMIDKMRDSAPEGQKDILADYLSAYCFGDFYTRKVLDLKMRELITFCAIVALGGCDPQAKAHVTGNISVGNSKQNLVDALALMLPWIGFPRTLNGLAAVNAAVPD